MNTRKYETILFSYREGIAYITLNRPERLNSFTSQMHEELRDVISLLESRVDLRGVILTGAGRGFCAGQDLSERKPLQPGEVRDLGESLEKNYKPLVMRLRALPVPVVCFVNGVAAGAGFSLVLACDIIYAVQSAKFIQAFAKIGLIPDAGSTHFLPRLIGTQRAMAASMLAQPISAEQAQAWGMIWKCIPDESLQDEIAQIHQTLLNGATKALAATKQAIYASSENTLEQQLDLETELQREMGATKDYREGSVAFIEKRSPVFQGA
ncbi:2-(1,2-epoxy-1,2-dihydrophenyl)acetyl-CoA isomerase [Advenella sp. WQ 585]|uniref:2-(1,2-epoxy-1,2-dihydrophenyl)acetyl-CoA isomerase n=1 Tax=Advenella mandrilli TaxID=2800330 RepID=A0ABS1E8L0_9BURK|nr:2-(1,2-epoxy-1,2-dihydrophenyl)acetyl-CoA isomerase PaaG [Advenella mandrilli]MBK1779679.1 2-(1,2-epoxy-1,2-dihydrophenyl)acetyl-CoA isomerase [Advenella mandrilli]